MPCLNESMEVDYQDILDLKIKIRGLEKEIDTLKAELSELKYKGESE